jgi:hypothetical protein
MSQDRLQHFGGKKKKKYCPQQEWQACGMRVRSERRNEFAYHVNVFDVPPYSHMKMKVHANEERQRNNLSKRRLSDGCSFICSTVGFFLQYLESQHVTTLSMKRHIVGYFHYVDDIRIMFDSSQTNKNS